MRKIVLENGLTILLDANDKHSVFVALYVNAGGSFNDVIVDNKPVNFKDGYAHYMEHSVLEYSKYGNLMKDVTSMNLAANGYTSPSYVYYFCEGISSISKGLTHLLTGINNHEFTEENVHDIKDAIYHEIDRHYDSVYGVSTDMIIKNSFINIPFKITLGSKEDLSKITVGDSSYYHKLFYQPQNEYVIISGGFNEEEILSQIKDCYKDLNNFKSFKLKKYDEPINVKKEYEKYIMNVPKTFINYSIKTVLVKDNKWLYAEYLDIYLESLVSKRSKLFKDLIENNYIDNQFNSYSYKIHDCILLSIKGYVNNKEEVLKRIKQEINLKNITRQEFDLIIKSRIANLLIKSDNLQEKNDMLIENITYFGKEDYDMVSDYKNIKYNELLKYIKSCDFSNVTIAEINNK